MAQLILLPNAAGDENKQSTTGGGAPGPGNYTQVYEAVPDGWTTVCYSIDGAAFIRDIYNMANVPTYINQASCNIINWLRVDAWCSDNNYGVNFGQVKLVLRRSTGGALLESGLATLTSSWVEYFSTVYLTNPWTLAAWQWTEINALLAGDTLKAPAISKGESRCTQMHITIDYTCRCIKYWTGAAFATPTNARVWNAGAWQTAYTWYEWTGAVWQEAWRL